MMGSMVSFSDYDGIEGFGAASQQDVSDLNKALSAGNAAAPIAGTGPAGAGTYLITESLEKTLHVVTYRMEHVKLWRALQKQAAFSTAEEYNRLESYGSNPDAGWISEGDLPEEDDSTYSRHVALMKYIGSTRRVTLQMSMVRTMIGNVIANETVNGTMHLLKMIETGLFTADASLSALQFDGFRTLMRANCVGALANNIIDMRGQPLNEDVIADAGLTVSEDPNWGQITDLYLNPKNKSDLIKGMFPKARYDALQKTKDGLLGLDIKGITTAAGDITFQHDSFITDGGQVPAAAVGDATKIPATPTVSTVATTPVTAAGLFTADFAGNYFYSIVAKNRYGASAPVVLSAGPAAVAVAAGDSVTWGMTPGSAITVSWYEVYRTQVGGASGTQRLILRVPNAAGAGEQTIVDLNAYLPFCYTAYGFQMNSEGMALKQLSPMLKVPLAQIDTSVRWSQVIFLVPVIYAFGKHVIFENVGRASGFVGAP